MGDKFSVYVKDDRLCKWIKEEVKSGKYRSTSHLFEYAVKTMRDREVRF